jgi:transcriptional regulator
VYVPAHFAADDEAVRDLLLNHGAADLITSTANGLLATMLPFIYEEPGSSPEAGERGRLLGHVARNNDQWRVPADGEALVIVRGPDAYISPTWYETKREHGRVVPTWNYTTAHVHGSLHVHDDPAWVEALVRRLTARHEDFHPKPWTVDDAPKPYIQGQLRAIVGLEVRITRIEAKLKLSQNRSDADVDGVIAGLEEVGRPDVAQAMREAGRPATPRRD